MAPRPGFEPGTFRLGGGHSIRLSYRGAASDHFNAPSQRVQVSVLTMMLGIPYDRRGCEKLGIILNRLLRENGWRPLKLGLRGGVRYPEVLTVAASLSSSSGI